MSEASGKCPSCDDPGEVGRACSGKVCAKRGYHFVPATYWERAHAGREAGPDPIIGQVIGDFLVVDLLGAGGFGKVFLALQSPLFRLRGALKLLDCPTDNERFAEALIDKFRGEAEVLAELSHPNIVRLIKYGTHRNRPYLVMEFLEKGLTLRQEVQRRASQDRSFSQDELRHIFHQLLNGLEAAHARKIIHRDLKPENIMLQRVVGNPYHVRILDFGIAKFVESRTDTKWPLGSPSYMAPEQVSLQNLGTWTDLYALGILFFELVTGRRPFPGKSDEMIMAKKIKKDFDPFERVADLGLPEAAVDFMGRAIAREPADRPQTVEQFRDGLDSALDALAGHAGGVSAGGRSLTMLIDSNDLVEVDSDAPGVDGPPALPEEASSQSSPTLPRAVLLAGLVGLLALGAFFVGGNYGELVPGDFGAALPTPDQGADSLEDAGDTDAPDTRMLASAAGETVVGLASRMASRTGADEADAGGSADADEQLEPHAMLQLAAGKYHTCGLRADGRVRCWGANFEGELGLGHARAVGDNEPVNFVEPLDFGRPARQIAAAGDRKASFSCALLQAGQVRCWGANQHGQLGYGHTQRLGDDETLEALGDVQLGGEAVELAVGASTFGSHSCVLLAGGDVRCWGSGKFGKLGYGHTNTIGDDEIPASVGTVALGAKARAIAAGKYNSCAILEDGSLRCWGWNDVGQLGLGHTRDIGDDEIPVSVEPIALGGKAEQVTVGRRHACAVLEDATVRCWGWNNRGQLGLGHADNVGDDEVPESVEPVALSGPARRVAAGALHSCALLDGGQVQCWGDNKFGQLGYAHTNGVGAEAAPSSVGTIYLGAPAEAIVAGSYHSCALLEAGQVRCWGYNDQGQLGYAHTQHIGDDEPPGSVSNASIE